MSYKGLEAWLETETFDGLREAALSHVWFPMQQLNDVAKEDGLKIMRSGRGAKITDFDGQEYYDGFAGLALVNWLYGYFVLPESLPPEKRDAFSWKKANPVGSLYVLGSYPLVAGLTAAFVFVVLAQRGLETVWVLYTGHKFGWDEQMNGFSLMLVGLMATIVQGGLVRPVVGWLGERRAILYGLVVAVVTYLGYGFATAGWMLFAFIVFGSIGGVAGPAIQSLVAGAVPPEDQGKVQGGITSLMSLTSILAPLVFTAGLFSWFTSPGAPVELPGAPFLLGAVMYGLAFWSLVRLFRRMPG